MDRQFAAATVSLTNQALNLTYFTAARTEAINNIAAWCTSPAAVATPTVCKMGIYSSALNGDLTLLGATANDPTMFAATFTRYARALIAPVNKVAGQVYAMALLVVSPVALPSLLSNAFAANAVIIYEMMAVAPRMTARLSGQSDLPANIPAGSLQNIYTRPYMEVLP